MLFSLIVFCTCETYLSASCQVEVFGDCTKDVRKFVRFQVIQVFRDTRDTLVCPETQVFRSQDTYRGNRDLLCTTWVSCVSNDDHFVIPVRILSRIRFG